MASSAFPPIPTGWGAESPERCCAWIPRGRSRARVSRSGRSSYRRIGHVAAVDLPLLAQLRPGDSLRFRTITLPEAQRLVRTREQEIARLTQLVRIRLATG